MESNGVVGQANIVKERSSSWIRILSEYIVPWLSCFTMLPSLFWCLSCSCDITLASISAGWEQSFSKDSVAHVQKYLTKNEVPNNLFEVRVLCYHFHQFSVEWSAYEEDAVFVHLRSIDPSPFDCFPLFIGSRTSRRSSLISEETSSGSLLRATSTLVSVSGRIWN